MKLVELEREVARLREPGLASKFGGYPSATVHTNTNDKRNVTAVIGNLDGFDSIVAATDWLKAELESLGAPAWINLYAKGEFQNIIFCEFENQDNRDTVVTQIQTARLQRNGNTIWSTPDRPPMVRAARKLCFGLKYFLKNT